MNKGRVEWVGGWSRGWVGGWSRVGERVEWGKVKVGGWVKEAKGAEGNKWSELEEKKVLREKDVTEEIHT